MVKKGGGGYGEKGVIGFTLTEALGAQNGQRAVPRKKGWYKQKAQKHKVVMEKISTKLRADLGLAQKQE